MPELPEIEALSVFLDQKLKGREVERCELGAIAALKTFNPPLNSVVGLTVKGVTRRGKFLCMDLDKEWLVLHLARAGWVKWSEPLSTARARPGRSPLALRLGFSGGSGIDVTEMGTQKRLAVWVVGDPKDVEGIASLGPDPLDASFDVESLRNLLAHSPGTVKNALTRQSSIAGVGNAYSDEALHAAKLSPFKPATRLSDEEVVRLYETLTRILREAVERSSGLSAGELKRDKKESMRVHGRAGETCPECGDTVREVSFSTKSLQYCPTCQTNGKVLADRRLSRILK